MENALQYVIVFSWCVCFGFFGVMGYLDGTMTTAPILAGLLAALAVYCAIEWATKKGELSWGSIKERFRLDQRG